MLFLLILVLSLIVAFITPWWVVAIIAFVMAVYAGKTPLQSFLSGFLAVFIVWTVLILVKSVPNNHVLASRVAAMVQLPGWTVLIFITALLGGLVGGMSALSGVLIKRLFANAQSCTISAVNYLPSPAPLKSLGDLYLYRSSR